MKCIRCHKEFNDYIPCRNAETYGGYPKYTCPHCGKLYVFRRIVTIDVEPCDYVGNREYDDWGHKVISDELYYKTNKKD